MKRRVVVAYIPVLHEGYRGFIERNAAESVVYLIGPDLTKGYRPLEKDIRALPIGMIKTAIEAWGLCSEVRVLTAETCSVLAQEPLLLVFPDEDISRQVAQTYFERSEIAFDSVFLRWDRRNSVVESPVKFDRSLDLSEREVNFLGLALEAGRSSSDWWRQVGAVIARDCELLTVAHNRNLPSELTPYVDGDSRSNFFKGVHLELTSAIHAEAAAIAEAAKLGIGLDGSDMFVTDFPCPPCAKLIAQAGIKRLYFINEYAVFDGEKILRSGGVELICVSAKNPPTA